jgi:hypothetical protein
VKNLIYVSFFSVLLALSGKYSASGEYGPVFECGVYHASGRLVYSQKQFIFIFDAGSVSAYEFILVGVPVQEALERVGTKIGLRFSIHKKITGSTNELSALVWQRWLSKNEQTNLKSGINTIANKECDLQ